MKRSLVLGGLALAALFASAAPSHAAIFFADDEAVTITQPTQSSAFLAGETITIEKAIRGDLFCAGLDVTINAPIEGDLICAAKSVTINAPITGDIRVVAIRTENHSTVNGRGTVFSSRLVFGPQAMIHREWNTWTQTTETSPTFSGAPFLASNQINEGITKPSQEARFSWLLLRYLTAIASALTVALVLGLFFPQRTSLAIAGMKKKPRIAIQLGIIATITAPVISFLLILTILGIPFGFALLALWVALAYSAQILTASMLGYLMSHQWIKDQKRLTYFAPAIGVPLLWLLFFIPVVGWLIRFIAITIGFAGIWITTERFIKKQVQKSP